jgi:nucleoid-associated protein YgaU
MPEPVTAATPTPAAVEAEPAAPRSVPVAVMELPGVGPASPLEPSAVSVSRVWIWQESGDCLWKMAKDHYGNPYLWPRIYEANRDRIKDPHVIFPKQEIVIPPLEASSDE